MTAAPPLPLAICLLCLLAPLTSTAREDRLITLEQAYDLTLASDQSIQIAAVALQQARLEPARAWTKLAPSLSADAGSSRRDNRGSGGSRSSTSGGITLQQPLLDLSFAPALRRGKLAVESAGMDYHFQIRETLFGVTQAYYDVLSQQQLVEVDKETLRLAEEQQTVAQNRLDAGAVIRTDVLRARVVVETARRTLIEDTSTLESLRTFLANLLNLESGAAFRVTEPKAHPADVPLFPELLKQALRQREDIRSSSLLIRQNEERIKEIRGAYAPSVAAQLDASTGDQSTGGSRFENDLQGSVSLRIPLFSAGQKAIDLRSASLEIQRTRLEHQQLLKQIEQDVKDAWLSARRLAETLEILRVQVDAAQASYTDLQSQYKAGTATNLDVLVALNELNTARRDLNVETYRWQIALRNLERVTGSFQSARVRKTSFAP